MIDNALTLMHERASRHGMALTHVLDVGLGEIRADGQKFREDLSAVVLSPGLSPTAISALQSAALSRTREWRTAVS